MSNATLIARFSEQTISSDSGNPTVSRTILFTLLGTLFTSITFNWVSQWLERGRWLFNGPQLLAEKYKNGIPFTIKTPERMYTLVSSPEHIKELGIASESKLSLLATAEEVFQPHHTMNGVELNRLGLQHRILRSLTSNFPRMQDTLGSLARESLTNELNKFPSNSCWKSVSIWDLAQNVIATTNTYTFYSEDLSRDSEFIKAAVQYPQDVFIASEVLRCTPSFLAPLVAWIVTGGHKASKHLIDGLIPMVKERIETFSKTSQRPRDYIEHIIHLYPEGIANRVPNMVRQTLALWFAGVHQPAISQTLFHALVDLCKYPEYQKALYEEIQSNINDYGSLQINKLPLLDSFLKESARLTTSETISLRRKAMNDYAFQDGTKVAKDDWVCVPQRALMRDPTIYPNPESFNGYRFLEQQLESSTKRAAKFTDLDPAYPIWGLGKQACPGRFYAAFILKIVLTEIITNYDVRLRNPNERRTFSWRSSMLPWPTSRIEMRMKEEAN
ncbi:cytochrome P450 [Aaosphaeria arxii CBS 175.79]|uniref:Cytochrome P450 n=1 Tax=Aaosphaeria arxii CBS 175.79 TaxID=1450172 RepID=A0A6A5XMT3_9PLEO|nr:cytochrome P450 [Aaosphaeria arxii CBS 175.79]KAF2014263.1 cytochrome P450 [Aaosphaeria arxii CBS 175.79]